MKKLVIASGLCMAVSGCIGFSWTSKVDDGAIYELNREMYIASREHFPQGQNFKKPKR